VRQFEPLLFLAAAVITHVEQYSSSVLPALFVSLLLIEMIVHNRYPRPGILLISAVWICMLSSLFSSILTLSDGGMFIASLKLFLFCFGYYILFIIMFNKFTINSIDSYMMIKNKPPYVIVINSFLLSLLFIVTIYCLYIYNDINSIMNYRRPERAIFVTIALPFMPIFYIYYFRSKIKLTK
jgi:hypothetical protein